MSYWTSAPPTLGTCSEEMKRLFFAMREVEPEDLDDETMDDFLKAMDQVSNVPQRVEKKRRVRSGKQ